MSEASAAHAEDRRIRVAVVMASARRLVRVGAALQGPGIDVLPAETIEDVRTDALRGRVDLLVTDRFPADGELEDSLRELLELGIPPVVAVVASRSVGVASLEAGAADYVVDASVAPELRVRTLLRSRGAAISRDEIGDLRIDHVARSVTVSGSPVDLTPREYDLLAFLAARPRRVFSRQQLLEVVWSASDDWQSLDTVTEHVYRIRRKVEEDPKRPRWIINVRGAGYRFDP